LLKRLHLRQWLKHLLLLSRHLPPQLLKRLHQWLKLRPVNHA
jgi:hypothetical protein